MDESSKVDVDNRPYSGAGFAPVESTISCVLTRFKLRSRWSLIPFYFGFRQVVKEARQIGGLLQAAFLIENLRTCYTFSLWQDEPAIIDFGTRVRSHVAVANSSFARTQWNNIGRPGVWSAQFRLFALSAHNLNWEGMDLRTQFAEQLAKHEASQ
jgi:hypothetical protein